MLTIAKNLYDYRELMATLAWKNIALRYKQAYLGIVWAILKMLRGLRVTEEEEYQGVDYVECGMEAYPEFTNNGK